MKVVFLAGGEGKRMDPILKDKCLLKFCGKELILHRLDLVKEVGFKEVVIIASPGSVDAFKSRCSSPEYKDLDIQFAIQSESKGMADAVLSAEKQIGDSEFLVVCVNDIIEPKAYKKMLELASQGLANAYLLGYKVENYYPGGYLIIEDEDKIKGIIEKPGEGNEPSNLVNIVFHLHRHPKKFFEFLKKAKTSKDDQYEVAMDNMIKAGYDYRVVPYDGEWVPIKYPWHIHNAMEHFIKKRIEKHGRYVSKNVNISDKANIVGDVIIEDGVRVFENTTVRGPCYIGKNVVVGNNALIWNYSHICDNSVVGFGTEVKHSYIGEACWFHTDYVGDSIIMDGSSFGSGTVTANFRFDEKNVKVKVGDSRFDTYTNKFGCIIGEGCKTGINVSILPGIKIGANSIVGPHVHLNKDLGSNKFIYVIQPQMVKTNPISIDPAKKAELMKKLKEGTGSKSQKEEAIKMYVRPFKSEDAEVCNKFIYRNFDKYFTELYTPKQINFYKSKNTPEQLRKVAKRDNTHQIVLVYENSVVGVATLENGCIRRIHVNDEYHGQGFGSAIVKYLAYYQMERGKIELSVYSSLPAVKFFAKNGFEEHETETLDRCLDSMKFVKMVKKVPLPGKSDLDPPPYKHS